MAEENASKNLAPARSKRCHACVHAYHVQGLPPTKGAEAAAAEPAATATKASGMKTFMVKMRCGSIRT